MQANESKIRQSHKDFIEWCRFIKNHISRLVIKDSEAFFWGFHKKGIVDRSEMDKFSKVSDRLYWSNREMQIFIIPPLLTCVMFWSGTKKRKTGIR